MSNIPHRYTVLIDFTKQIVTTSAAILSVGAAFGTPMLRDAGQSLWLFLAAGIAFLVAIFCGWHSHSLIINYISENSTKGEQWNAAAGWANGAFWAFFAACIFLITFGIVYIKYAAPT